MRKKVLSAVLAATMVAGMMGNVVSVSAEEKVLSIRRAAVAGETACFGCAPDGILRKAPGIVRDFQ